MKRAALALSLLFAATLNAQHLADPSTSKPLTPPPVINVNTATPAQLMYLPGVGKVMAGRIADYRAQHGQLRKPSDLMQVKGIGAKKLAALQPFIALTGPTTATRKIRPCSVNETGAQCQARVGDAAEVVFYPGVNLNLIETY